MEKFSFWFQSVLVGLIVSASLHLFLFQDLRFFVPYAMLLTSDRIATVNMWRRVAVVDRGVEYPPRHVPVIDATAYSFEVLREATDNFRRPAVVRNLFKDSIAVTMWGDREYLPSKFGDTQIPVILNGTVGTLQDKRVVESFASEFQKLYDAESTSKYLFFPVKSRIFFNGSAAGSSESLEKLVNEIVMEDIGLEKIRPGFGGPAHKSFQFSQFVIGKSFTDENTKATGSDWHCAPGNNYFIQVVGRKKWDFIDPVYSPYLWPLKGGVNNMWTANPDVAKDEKHIPTWTVVLEPGDMVYNPDWMWHKITNFDGLSIGVPAREGNATNIIRNNPIFTGVVFAGKMATRLGMSLGGYAGEGSSASEHDN